MEKLIHAIEASEFSEYEWIPRSSTDRMTHNGQQKLKQKVFWQAAATVKIRLSQSAVEISNCTSLQTDSGSTGQN